MARSKYFGLEEARKLGKLDQFAREHEFAPEAPSPRERFDALFKAMALGKPAKGDQTSVPEFSKD